MRRGYQAVTVVALLILAGLLTRYSVNRYDVPFVRKYAKWSIGIYFGPDPLTIGPTPEKNNPVLTASDVTDVDARFVADPFMIFVDGRGYMFFEVMNSQTDQGDLGLAVSEDGEHWDYRQIVLDEPFHLSYPYVFEWEGEIYLLPETSEASSVRLYRAREFPTSWVFVGNLMAGYHLDPSVFRYAGKWWMFSTTTATYDVTRLYFSESLTGNWEEHPQSPIVWRDATKARPAGRVLVDNDRIIRFSQNDKYCYGASVRAFEVLTLSDTQYREREITESPVLQAGDRGWNAMGMHHVDVQQFGDRSWIAAVDGWRTGVSVGLYYW